MRIANYLSFDIQKEIQSCEKGNVKYFNKKINGLDTTIVIINREDGFKILKINHDGDIEELYK